MSLLQEAQLLLRRMPGLSHSPQEHLDQLVALDRGRRTERLIQRRELTEIELASREPDGLAACAAQVPPPANDQDSVA